jgi:lysozyme
VTCSHKGLTESRVIQIDPPQNVDSSSGTTSNSGIEFIGIHEGLDLNLYNDPAGHATIGYGHLVHLGPINGSEPEEFRRGITEQRALELLKADLAIAEQAVKSSVKVPINQQQFDALVSFTFNVGKGSLEISQLLVELNAGNYGRVPYELNRWVHGGGVVLPGLVTRRRNEGILFSQGIYV